MQRFEEMMKSTAKSKGNRGFFSRGFIFVVAWIIHYPPPTTSVTFYTLSKKNWWRVWIWTRPSGCSYLGYLLRYLHCFLNFEFSLKAQGVQAPFWPDLSWLVMVEIIALMNMHHHGLGFRCCTLSEPISVGNAAFGFGRQVTGSWAIV